MANSVFGVVQGSGTTEVEGKSLTWNSRRRDRGAVLA